MVEVVGMRAEKLPKGFTRRKSGSLRVQIRVGGHVEVKHFPITSNTVDDRRRQLIEAEAWASETRRKIVGGSHVSHREAERTTLEFVLKAYEREGLVGDPANVAKERPRIVVLLKDPISRKTLAQLRKTDIAALRDRLMHAGWLRSVERAARRVETSGSSRAALAQAAEYRSLPELAIRAKQAGEESERRELQDRIAGLTKKGNVKQPARTSVSNIVQLVTRALKHASQTIEGVPDLTGVPMPKGSPGRERRVSDHELRLLLSKASETDARLALVIRFAIATALRRERLLSCQTSHVRDIGGGKRAIVFPRDAGVRKKRTGITPITKEIQEIIDQALSLQGSGSLETMIDVPIFGLKLAAFESQWRRLIAATGIKNLTFHDLRHEATSRLFERGLTTAEVMSITGHSTQEMVDRYSHYSAALVLAKLERGNDRAALLSEIAFLVSQFQAVGGELEQVRALVQ